MRQRKTIPIITLIIAFVVYNVIVFSLSGLTGFSSAFWASYASVLVYFITLLLVFVRLGLSGMSKRDWFFSIPIVNHTIIYTVLTVLYSVVFLILGNLIYVAIPITLIAVTWLVYIIMFFSCLYIKDNSDSISNKNKEKSGFIIGIRTRANRMCSNVSEDIYKAKFIKLKDITESSMPYTYSGGDNSDIENEIINKMDECEDLVNGGDYVAANALCDEVIKLIEKRNSL